jgi:glycosyltransferase involved in cell wall biosynthesis
MAKKLGIVVQRYGIEINGGAEYHAKLIAEKLSKYYSVEVFTTTALDYITWEHHYTEKTEKIEGVTVNRFKVSQIRDPEKFGVIQEHIFTREHSFEDELDWLREEGPYVPDLITELEKRENEFSFYIFFSYRYYHSFQGITRFGNKAILVPTAEQDAVIYLRLFKDFFNLPGAIVYNSHEEKEIIHQVSGNQSVLGDIVGVGSEIPEDFDPGHFRQKYKISGRYFIYIGRLDENKGIPELFHFYLKLLSEVKIEYTLILMGKSLLDIPEHPRIKYLGFMDNQDKFNALKGSDFLIIPSQFESLSMVALEAWAIGKPVVANGRTAVLKGQCQRSNAGLWYTNYDEFKEVLLLIYQDSSLRKELGKNGQIFFQKNYSWPVIEKKYINIMNNLEMAESK